MSACQVCSKNEGPLFACCNCREAIYCSKQHADQDWVDHKLVCVKPGEPKYGKDTKESSFKGLLNNFQFNYMKMNSNQEAPMTSVLPEGRYFFRLDSAAPDKDETDSVVLVFKTHGRVKLTKFTVFNAAPPGKPAEYVWMVGEGELGSTYPTLARFLEIFVEFRM